VPAALGNSADFLTHHVIHTSREPRMPFAPRTPEVSGMKKRMFVAVFSALALVGATQNAAAQGEEPGAGRFEVGFSPFSWTWFSKGDTALQPSFKNYALGVTGTYNANTRIGLEAELGRGIGLKQTLDFNNATFENVKIPNSWAYNGNVVYNVWGSDHRWVPYVTGGIGGLTVNSRTDFESFGFLNRETFFTQNAGAGVKWFATHRWGLRGDYRYINITGKTGDTAPQFFGEDQNRHGNRFYGSFVLTY